MRASKMMLCAAALESRLQAAPWSLIRLRAPAFSSRLKRLKLGGGACCKAFSIGETDGPRKEDDENDEESGDEAAAKRKRMPSKWMIVGLGNPGTKFQGTRHNVGFDAIDYLALQESIKLNTIQCKALVGKGQIENIPVLLVKPQTYMNLSGDAVYPLALYYKVPLSNLVVMYDDMDLDVAIMKLAAKGGPGGHNGMKHIIEKFKQKREIPRLRIGIGKPPGSMDSKAYVLQKFTSRERQEIDVCIARAADGIRQILREGLEKTISQWNPPKRSRDPTSTAYRGTADEG